MEAVDSEVINDSIGSEAMVTFQIELFMNRIVSLKRRSGGNIVTDQAFCKL